MSRIRIIHKMSVDKQANAISTYANIFTVYGEFALGTLIEKGANNDILMMRECEREQTPIAMKIS